MIVAVDTGGTKTLVAVFDTEGQVVAEQKFPTPKEIDTYLAQLKTTIDGLMTDRSITCLSIALPGTITDGKMIWAANLDWRDTDMTALLKDHYDCPIVVENDANLAGLAEARSLSEVPGVCLYLTVSTGIGTGVIIDGKIHPRLSRSEGGRIVLRRGDTYDIWELFASGKAMQQRYGKLASEISDEATWNAISEDLAQGMLALLPFLQPDVVVIGGGVGAHFDRFGTKVERILADNLVDAYSPVLVQAAHPEEAVVYGCYYHALDTLTD